MATAFFTFTRRMSLVTLIMVTQAAADANPASTCPATTNRNAMRSNERESAAALQLDVATCSNTYRVGNESHNEPKPQAAHEQAKQSHKQRDASCYSHLRSEGASEETTHHPHSVCIDARATTQLLPLPHRFVAPVCSPRHPLASRGWTWGQLRPGARSPGRGK